MSDQTIEAKDHLDPQGLIVNSASLLADHLISRLNEGLDVEVSLSGIKGVSSSYFNVVLGRLVDTFGRDVVIHRVRFRFDSEAQRQVYGRSLDAILKVIA